MNKTSLKKASIKRLLLLPIIIIIASYSQASFASVSNCAVVSTKTMFLKKNEFNVLLKFGPNIEHDGSYSWEYNKRILLAPGKHRIKAKAIGPGHRGNSEMAVTEGILDSKGKGSFEFELDFEEGYIYRLVAQEIKSSSNDTESSFRIKVKSKKPKKCFQKQENIISVVPSTKLYKNDSNEEQNNVQDSVMQIGIPSDLQYRLDLLTKDLHAYYKLQAVGPRTVSLVQERRITKKLGIVTDTHNKVKQGILVVAVSPLSLAAQIGLLAGDQIVALKINGVSRSQDEFESIGQFTAIDALKRNLNNLIPEDSILFKVKRGNKLQELSATYDTMSLPAYQLGIHVN